jgi:DNA-binding XRE family transcriptional regulator
MVNVNKLKGKIVECGLNIEELSSKIGINKTTFYRKMSSDGKYFTIEEADLISKELNLTYDEVNSIFFSQYVA